MARDNIRNFCIIAHIDHGKSTLSDRILELTKSVDERTMEDQILDNMDIERERGITIKARAVTMNYTAKDGKTYEFNLIDTPGHVDFAYEVSRSLAACEGAILVVDATQGVEAQTLANTYMALEHDLELVPILNKIDLPSAHPDEVAQEVEDVIGLPCLDAPRVSAKTGLNVDQVLHHGFVILDFEWVVLERMQFRQRNFLNLFQLCILAAFFGGEQIIYRGQLYFFRAAFQVSTPPSSDFDTPLPPYRQGHGRKCFFPLR